MNIAPARFEKVARVLRSRSFGMALVWALIAAAAFGTHVLTRDLRGSDQAAAAYLSGETKEIGLWSDRAEPASIAVASGEEVAFVVRDGSRHNLAEERRSKKDARLESGEFGEGESYSLVFTGKGEYSLYDRHNPDIRISITVR